MHANALVQNHVDAHAPGHGHVPVHTHAHAQMHMQVGTHAHPCLWASCTHAQAYLQSCAGMRADMPAAAPVAAHWMALLACVTKTWHA